MSHPRVRHTQFQRSLDPMLICDRRRRCVDANVAACLFLRLPREAILSYAVDDLVAEELRAELESSWPTFEPRPGPLPLTAVATELGLPDGARLAVTIAVASYSPGRDLAIIRYPPLRALTDDVEQLGPPGGGVLTRREREVLSLVARGRTGLEIAAQLFLSPLTVQTHVTNALLKLGATNRSHGIAIALQTGEIELGELAEGTGPVSAPQRG